MLQTVKRIVGFVLLAAFLISFAYIMYVKVTNHAPGLFGFGVVRVDSDDMLPVIESGEIVIIKELAPEELSCGDVVAYRCEKGSRKGDLVVHQLSKEPVESEGVYYFTARSLSEYAVDDPVFSEKLIIGKVLFVVPFLGSLYDFFSQWYGLLAFLGLLLMLFGEDLIAIIRRFTQRPPVEDSVDRLSIEDIRHGEHIMVAQEKEFESIITDLDESDE